LSGRQGDKAKRSLIEQGFIEEAERLTPKGRSKSIRLTESGKLNLGAHDAASDKNQQLRP
jgi:chromosome segregation and condensation protein ScpB